MGLIRTLFLAGAVYLYYIMAFPGWTGQAYHVASLSIICGGAVALFFFLKMVEIGSFFVKLGAELAFVAAVALYLGYTMPQASGRPPIEQWLNGARPTQSGARQGLERLGVDPHGAVVDKLVGLFPKG